MSAAGRIFRWAVIIVFTIVTLVPLLWLLMSSFKTNQELFTNPFGLPEHWSFDNYVNALTEHPLFVFLKNSALTAVISTVIVLICALLSAYALLHRFRLSRAAFSY